ncbi:hypothetical protein B0I37DRAFT_366552 [Chaetomium sp. MPI-CAGE-AT-0009]|nr:hypothetical protein B0I37DRAFT_366552 [Chaetomium sp. MPI-CAGE-AT-0009]
MQPSRPAPLTSHFGRAKGYTARMAAALPDDLALSTTYIPSTGVTYSVVYGCNDSQMDEIWRRMSSASDHADHPLLVVGIFMELDRERLIGMAECLADKFTLGSDILENKSWESTNPKMQGYLEVCLRSRTLIDYIRAVKRQLAKVLVEIDELEKLWHQSKHTGSNENANPTADKEKRQRKTSGMLQTGEKMKQRIQEMLDEYDDKIDECKKMAQNLSLAMQSVREPLYLTYLDGRHGLLESPLMDESILLTRSYKLQGWNQIARQDSVTNTRISRANTMIALETKRESAQMRSIALLTMIYLPLSCVASVFSTTLFNWNPGEGETIVSKYIWVLLTLALVLTLITVLAWHLPPTARRRGRARGAGLSILRSPMPSEFGKTADGMYCKGPAVSEAVSGI